MTLRAQPKPALDKIEALLGARKDARLATPKWKLKQTKTGAVLAATLKVTVRAPDQDLIMRATWNSPSRQQIMLQLPETTWNLCRLCLCRHHDNVHWHCLDNYAPNERRTTPANTRPAAYAINEMFDEFVTALKITGFTPPMRTWE